MATSGHVQFIVGQLDGTRWIARQLCLFVFTQIEPVLWIFPSSDYFVTQHVFPPRANT
jgi:hypothetical protein